MLNKSVALLFVFLTTNLNAQNNSLTLEDIFYSEKYLEHKIGEIKWLADESGFTYSKHLNDFGYVPVEDYQIIFHNVKTGEEDVLLTENEVETNGSKTGLSHYQWKKNFETMLIAGKEEKIWRHSWQAAHFLYETKTKKMSPLVEGATNLRNVRMSNDGRKVCYVRDYNIYVHDVATGEKKALTTDGTANILNGEFDWVYEEEFGSAMALKWSPDSKKIAFWQIDQTRVKEFNLLNQMPFYNEVFKLKYPKAGSQNALVKIGVVDVVSAQITWMDLGAETDIYIPKIFWASGNQLAVLRLNRHQNNIELLMADVNTGETKAIIEDKNDTWIDVYADVLFLKKQKQIIWPSERDGYKHAYLFDYEGNLVNQITSGKWEITAIEDVDLGNGTLYFYGKKDSPLEQHAYRIKFDGAGLTRLSQRAGWHSGSFSPNLNFVVGQFSDTATPTQISLRKNNGKLVRFIEKNEMSDLATEDLPKVDFLKIKTDDGVELDGYIIKPTGFDEDKKYPVLVYGYGGPGSQTVLNRWGGARTLWHKYLATNGTIVFCLDNRGTGGQGKAFKDLAYGDISKWAVHDQVEGAKYLQSLPYVDPERLAFWGWSGGGYLTLMMTMRAPEYFKTGVAVAPVSDFRFYDTIWTEAFMGLPQENKAGYDAANVLEYVQNLKGNLLIIHGTGDDNVHVQNTMQVVSALQNRGINFDLMIYPNKNHRIHGGKTQLHLFRYIAKYLRENL